MPPVVGLTSLPDLAKQVFHLYSPKICYLTLDWVLGMGDRSSLMRNNWPVLDLRRQIDSMQRLIEAAPPALVELFNDPENTLATSDRLGALRENLLVRAHSAAEHNCG